MSITYSDPYKDNPFGKIKGTKNEAYAKLVFEEAKFYQHEEVLYLAGYFIAFGGVTRAFGSGAINPVLCELPIYGKEYTIRQKKEGTGTNGTKSEWVDVVCQPSINEKLLYQHITDNPAKYLLPDKALRGEITFNADDTIGNLGKPEYQLNFVLAQFKTELIEPSGKHPDWTPPKSYRGSSYSGSRVNTPDEKLEFAKKELRGTILDAEIKDNDSLPLAAYVHQVINENSDNERFLALYFDLVNAIAG